MKRMAKRIISSLLIVTLALGVNTKVQAEGLGSSGESSKGYASGGSETHEIWCDTAIQGFRIYLVPAEVLFSKSVETQEQVKLKNASDFEDWSKYCTYLLVKTRVSDGALVRVCKGDKFAFNTSNSFSDLKTLKPNTSGSSGSNFCQVEDYNVYDADVEPCKLITAILRSRKVTNRTKGIPHTSEYSDANECFLNDFEGKKFREKEEANIAEKNWAVFDGNQNFFTDCINLCDKNSLIYKYSEGKSLDVVDLYKSFIDYTVKVYGLTGKEKIASLGGTRSEYKDSSLGIVIEPVFTVYNVDSLAGGPMVMTGTQYARYALNKNSNWYDGHGIAYWYDKNSGGEGLINGRSSANYVYGRTTNSTKTKRGSLTAYNYLSTLRPYQPSDIKENGLNEYGGIGVIYGRELCTDANVNLGVKSYAEYKVQFDTAGDVSSSSNVGVDSKNSSDIKGSLSDFVNNSTQGKLSTLGKADKLTANIIASTDTEVGYVPLVLRLDNANLTAFLNSKGITYDKINSKGDVISKELTKAIEKGIKDLPVELTILNGKIGYNGYPDNKNTQDIEFFERGIVESVVDALMIKNNALYNGMATYKSEDKYKTSDIQKLTTLYTGNLIFEKNEDNSIIVSGDIPVVVATKLNAPSIKSYVSEIVYKSVDDDSTISFKGSRGKTHSSSLAMRPYSTEPTGELINAEYLAFTFDNTKSNGDYIQTGTSNSPFKTKSFKDGVKKIIDSYGISTSNKTEMFDKLVDLIASTTGVSKSSITYESIGRGVSAKDIVLDVRGKKKSGKIKSIYGTNVLVISCVGANTAGSVTEGMRQYELNTIENFYSEAPYAITNASSVSDIPMLSSSSSTKYEFVNRVGSPIYDNSPMIGGFLIDTYLSSSGVNAMKPVMTWSSTRSESFSNKHGGSGSVSTESKLYSISRAKFSDKKTIADYSIWNTNKYPASEAILDSTAKNVLEKYGFAYGMEPVNDKTNQGGLISTDKLTGTYGKQKIKTVNDAGWKITTSYNKYNWINATKAVYVLKGYDEDNNPIYETEYVDDSHWSSPSSYTETKYSDGVYKFNVVDSNGLISFTDSRDYQVKYSINKYTPYLESNQSSGSTHTFNNKIESKAYDTTIGQNSIAKNGDSVLSSMNFSDKSSSVLGIYPEVRMQYNVPSRSEFKFGDSNVSVWSLLGDEYKGYGNGYNSVATGDGKSDYSVTKKYVYTVGEKARFFNPTSYMDVQLLGEENRASRLSESDVSAVLTSSAVSTSSRVKKLLSTIGVGEKTPVILSGGNIAVNADTKIKAKITSYSIDLASIGDNLVSAKTGNEINIKSLWSGLAVGEYSAENTHSTFVNNFVSNIEQSLNIVVKSDSGVTDQKLISDESQSKTMSTTLDSVYNIAIRDGVVLNKDTILTEIASDLLSESTNTLNDTEATEKARKIYDSLDIENMIIKQLETKNSKKNKSEDNWYDEACSTIVIRKYTSIVDVGSVIASDKLDITWGPKMSVSNNSTKYNSLYSKGYKAGIKYILGMKNDKVSLPSGKSVTVDKKLVSSMLRGCDFVIPDATINDSKY